MARMDIFADCRAAITPRVKRDMAAFQLAQLRNVHVRGSATAPSIPMMTTTTSISTREAPVLRCWRWVVYCGMCMVGLPRCTMAESPSVSFFTSGIVTTRHDVSARARANDPPLGEQA